jgi:hypothetical protein
MERRHTRIHAPIFPAHLRRANKKSLAFFSLAHILVPNMAVSPRGQERTNQPAAAAASSLFKLNIAQTNFLFIQRGGEEFSRSIPTHLNELRRIKNWCNGSQHI